MKNTWTHKEDVFIIKNYGKLTLVDMSKYLKKRSINAISKRINRIIKKDTNAFEQWFSKNAPDLSPMEAIESLRRIGLRNPEIFYKNWRENYLFK